MSNKLMAFSSISPNLAMKESMMAKPEKESIHFKDVFKNALSEVNKVENEANLKTEALIQGKTTDMHDVMISAQKARITVEATVQIQQKVIDAYNEIMRMQV